ncbi:MAG TPA: hypothetical protein DCS74_01130 [Veillonellaceae bacterium]|nr:hypothetical protein [Veillonellaceae bacterium]
MNSISQTHVAVYLFFFIQNILAFLKLPENIMEISSLTQSKNHSLQIYSVSVSVQIVCEPENRSGHVF